MKRNRKMLLAVTATSMTAVVVACTTPHPVGMVADPHDQQPVADAAPSPDIAADAEPPPEIVAPSVGTTAIAPDNR